MTELAGEIADGFMVAPLATRAFLEQWVRPALGRGRDRRGESFDDPLTVCAMPFVVTGTTEEALCRSMERTKARIAFYASTPNYAPVLALHGLEEMQVELADLARRQRWDAMTGLVSDDVLELFAVVAAPSDLFRRLRDRYQGLADRVALYSMGPLTPQTVEAIFDGVATGA